MVEMRNVYSLSRESEDNLSLVTPISKSAISKRNFEKLRAMLRAEFNGSEHSPLVTYCEH
jgi:hypothetical protein